MWSKLPLAQLCFVLNMPSVSNPDQAQAQPVSRAPAAACYTADTGLPPVGSGYQKYQRAGGLDSKTMHNASLFLLLTVLSHITQYYGERPCQICACLSPFLPKPSPPPAPFSNCMSGYIASGQSAVIVLLDYNYGLIGVMA